MPRWDFRLIFAGNDLTIPDVGAQWVERGAALKPGRLALSVSVKARVPYDFAEQVEAGHHPYTAQGVIMRDGVTLLSGRVSRCSYGTRAEPVSLTIQVSNKDTATFPGGFEIGTFTEEQRFFAAVDAFTAPKVTVLDYGFIPLTLTTYPDFLPQRLTKRAWTNIATGSEGVTHVVVFGSPGSSDNAGSPTYIVDNTVTNYQFAIAGHATEAQQVHIWYKHQTENRWARNSTAPLSVQHIRQDGRTVSTVDGDVSIKTHTGDAALGEFFVDWSGGQGLDGRAGEVLRILLGHSSVQKDWARMEPALQRLNAYRFDGYINDDVTPLEYVTRSILPILPASLHVSGSGVYIEMWPWLDGGDDVAFRLEADGLGFSPAGEITFEDAAVRSITLDYAYSPLTKTYTKTYTADAATTYSPNVHAGEKTEDLSIKTRMVWDETTARSLVDTRMRYLSTHARIRRYTCNPDIYGIGGTHELKAGMPVSITDSGVAWTQKLAWIDQIERTGDSMSVTLRIREW